MKIDCHLHTTFSCDSSIKPEIIVDTAVEKGYTALAITDHYDLHPLDRSKHGLPDLPRYKDVIDALCMKYADYIALIRGIEFSEPHRYPDEFSALLTEHAPEFIIASLHRMPDTREVSVFPMLSLTDDDIREYYEEHVAMTTVDGIHCIGHLGIFERYGTLPCDKTKYFPVIDKIFAQMIANGIALEVNFSGLRKSLRSIIPDPSVLKRYRECGGRLLTLGSDSHQMSDFDTPYETAVELIRECGFNELFYRQKNTWKSIPI